MSFQADAFSISRKWWNALAAILIVAIASAIRAAFFTDLGRGTPYLTYYPAVALAALYGGLASGTLATVLSTSLSFYWLQLGYTSHVESMAMGVFVVSSTIVAGFAEAMIRARTRAKHAELAIKKLSRNNKLLLNAVGQGIYGVDEEGNTTFINPAAEKMLGWRNEELFGKPMHGILHHTNSDGSPYPPVECPAYMTLHDGMNHHMVDEVFWRKDGTSFPVEYTSAPILDEDNSLIGAVAVFADSTERKLAEAKRTELEAQLQESQKMEALGTLAGGVAHDFNNTLASILGNVELARQDVGPGHEALVSLEEIGKASRRAKDLVQQILTFGRRAKLERKPTSLALVVVESARLLRATLPAKVVLNVDCQPDTPAVLADATQVSQVFLNLCGNALQAVQDQERPGVIEVRLAAHTVDVAAHNGLERRSGGDGRHPMRVGRYACLSVRDNGAGMDKATRTHIFEPFFTTKAKGKGTGLGLSVVHGIVQTHQASIEVESAPGGGSTFHIYFPAIDALVAEVAAPAADTVPADGNGIHVLYLDNEQAIVFLMKRLLERQGYRVSGFTEPHEAVAAVRSCPDQFDLAVSDYNMPGMSGLEVAKALREIRPDLPVVLASGYITEELRAQAPAAGIRELINKPNTVDDLCAAVARCANAQAMVNP